MNHKLSYVVLFLVSPLLGTLVAFKNVNRKTIVFFSMLTLGTFGFLYHYGGSGDGTTHYEIAKFSYNDVSLGDFLAESVNIVQQNPSGPVDLYIHCLYFFTSSVLQWPELLHLFAGLILGYIIGKTLELLAIPSSSLRGSRSNVFFLIILIAIHSVFEMNAIRIGTAMWLALYSILGYAKTKKFKYLFILLLTMGVHLAYALIILPVMAALVMQKFKWVVVAIFFLSFGLQMTNLDASAYMPKTKTAEVKANYILDQDDRYELNARQTLNRKSLNIYAALGHKFYMHYGISVLIFLFIPLYLKIPNNIPAFFLMTVVLLAYAFSNVVVFMPHLVARVQFFFAVTFLVVGFLLRLRDIKPLVSSFYFNLIKASPYYLLCATLLYFLTRISHILDTTSIFFIAAPFFSKWQGVDISLREAILSLL